VLESMTGYARAEVALAGTPVTLELRSVNHRFLDLTLRLPEALRDQEGAVRARLRDAVSRGKVDLIVRIEGGEGQGGALQPEMLATVLKAVTEVRAHYPEAQPDSPLELLRWPGVWATTQPDLAALKACFWEGLEVVLNDFLRERQREGAGLQRTLELRLAQLGDLVGTCAGCKMRFRSSSWPGLGAGPTPSAWSTRKSGSPRSWPCWRKKPIFARSLTASARTGRPFFRALANPGLRVSASTFSPRSLRERPTPVRPRSAMGPIRKRW
jgi:hypothetical protein